MAVKIVGVSLEPVVLGVLDELARGEGVTRSAMVARLVEGERLRRSRAGRRGGPAVVVDGVRFVPARARSGG